MSRWLRDVDVRLKSTPPLRAPGIGGFVDCGCFIDTYVAVTSKQLRTPSTIKVFVELNPDLKEPWTHPEARFQGTEIATVKWPIDLSRFKNVTADEWIRIHFEEMHAGILHLASIRKWPDAPLEAARKAVVESNYRFTGLHGEQYTSPNRKHRMQFRYNMNWEWFTLEAILLNQEQQELGRKEIARYPACSGPLPRYMRGKSRWNSNEEFVFISSDNWFEPRQSIVQLADFVRQ